MNYYLATLETDGLHYLGPCAMPPPGVSQPPYIIPLNAMHSSSIAPFNSPFTIGQMSGNPPIMPLPSIYPPGGLNMTPFNGGSMPPPLPNMPIPGMPQFSVPGANPFSGGPPIWPLSSMTQSSIAPFSAPGIASASQPWTGMVAPAATTHAASTLPPTYSTAATGLHEGTDTVQSTGGNRLHWIEAGMQGRPIRRGSAHGH